jgi:hypothetical protein
VYDLNVDEVHVYHVQVRQKSSQVDNKTSLDGNIKT